MLPLLAALALPPLAGGPPPPAVEFDFAPIPLHPGHMVEVALYVVAEDGDAFWDRFGYEDTLDTVGDINEETAGRMVKGGLRAVLAGNKTKVRVTGWPGKDGRPRAVVYGWVVCRGLTADQWPTVTNPPPPPVVFDLGPVPADPPAGGELALSVRPADGGPRVRVAVPLAPRADLPGAAAAAFNTAGLAVEAAGDAVRVAGWAAEKDAPARPAAAGQARSDRLAASSRG